MDNYNILFLIFRNFFEKSQKLQKSQFLLGTLLPPVTLVVINFSKNCNFSNFSQFLEKLQFLLDTLLPPVPLDLINFSKNCDFSNFFATFGEIAVFAGHPSNSCNTWLKLILAKTAISPIFTIFGGVAEIAEIAVFAGHPCTSCNTWLIEILSAIFKSTRHGGQSRERI